MVGDAARGGGRLLQGAEAGGGLAGVEDAAVRAGDGVGELAGERRDAAQALEKVEGDALAGKQQAGGAADFGDDVAVDAGVAILLVKGEVGVELGEHFRAGEDQGLARDKAAAGLAVGGDTGMVVMSPGPISSSSARRTMSVILAQLRFVFRELFAHRFHDLGRGLRQKFSSESWRSRLAIFLTSCSFSLSTRLRWASCWPSGTSRTRSNWAVERIAGAFGAVVRFEVELLSWRAALDGVGVAGAPRFGGVVLVEAGTR